MKKNKSDYLEPQSAIDNQQDFQNSELAEERSNNDFLAQDLENQVKRDSPAQDRLIGQQDQPNTNDQSEIERTNFASDQAIIVNQEDLKNSPLVQAVLQIYHEENKQIEEELDLKTKTFQFLKKILNWKDEKFYALSEFQDMNEVAQYLDAYSLDETGLRNHSFVKQTDSQECKVCQDPLSKHYDFQNCIVCYKMCKPSELLTLTPCCDTFCRTCWSSFIQSRMQEGQMLRIECLNSSCGAALDEKFIQQLLSQTEFARYIRYNHALLVDTNKNLIFCPNSDCQTLINRTEKPLQCKSCLTQACAKCDLKAHIGQPCPRVGANDVQFRAWAAFGAKLGVKNCPKCQTRTEKSTGCNHMTCARCKAEWCWICNQIMQPGHYNMSLRSIFSGCPGMQHTFKEGSGVRFYLGLISLWLFNIPLFALVPSLIGILVSLAIPYMIIYMICGFLIGCVGKQSKYQSGIMKILLYFTLSLFVFVFAQFFFCVILYLSVVLIELLALLISLGLLLFISPLITIGVPIFMSRVTLLTMKRLR